jgi:hypothetical protein
LPQALHSLLPCSHFARFRPLPTQGNGEVRLHSLVSSVPLHSLVSSVEGAPRLRDAAPPGVPSTFLGDASFGSGSDSCSSEAFATAAALLVSLRTRFVPSIGDTPIFVLLFAGSTTGKEVRRPLRMGGHLK